MAMADEAETMLSGTTAAAEATAAAAGAAAARPTGPSEAEGEGATLDLILDVPLALTVEFGRVRMPVKRLLALGAGSVIELTKLVGEPLDVLINGKRVARGEAVVVNDKFGVRLTEIASPSERVERLR